MYRARFRTGMSVVVNSELYSLYNDPNIVEDVKIRRLGWADHVIRMEEERIPKKVLNGKLNTTRPVGRPRNREVDVVQRDALQPLWVMEEKS